MTPGAFRQLVWRHARKEGRHALPWRATHDPYRILVSEVMLQQTQVERVVPYYRDFIKKFPTARRLAAAPLSAVLSAWQGLGYNRRAKMLHDAAKEAVRTHSGNVPTDVAKLESLPGVGPYTARAVAAFAANTDSVLIETNIRTAVLHHFFDAKKEAVSDRDIQAVLERVHPKGRAREWYGALMDYGAHLKRSGVKLNARAKGYAKQSSFKGSLREVRGSLLRLMSTGIKTESKLRAAFPPEREAQVRKALGALLAEGMIVRRGKGYRLPPA